MTAYKQAHGEHYTHEVVPFADIVLVRVPKPTHSGLQEGNCWHKGDAVFIKGVGVGRSDLSDEHIVFTPGGRVFSRTIRRLEPSRRHDAGFLDEVMHRTCCRVDRERNLHHHHPFWSERTLRVTILTCQTRLRRRTLRRPRRQTTRMIMTVCL